MAEFDIIAVGESLIDFVPGREQVEGQLDFSGFPGGAVANVLGCVAKLGGKTSFITKIGDDIFGGLLLRTFKKYGVDTSNVVVSKEYPTTLAFVALDEDGDRVFSFYRDRTADVMLCKDDVDASVTAKTRVFHFGSLSLTAPVARETTYYLLEEARRAGTIITYDPNLREPLWHSLEEARLYILEGMEYADAVKVSQEEVTFLTGETDMEKGIHTLYDQYGLKMIAATLGGAGCLCYAGGEYERVPGFRVATVDTVGAGDAFFGAVISGLLERGLENKTFRAGELKEILRYANAVAAISTTRHGGISSLPDRTEVNEFLAGRDR